MKRRSRKKKSITNKTIYIVLFVVFIFISAGYALFSQELNIGGWMNITPVHQYRGVGRVTATLGQKGNWGTGPNKIIYSYNFEIENTSSTNIEGWVILVNMPSDARLYGSGGGEMSIKNGILTIMDTGSNGTIAPGVTNKDPYIQLETSDQNFEITYLVLNGIQMNLSGGTTTPTAIHINEKFVTIFTGQTSTLSIRFEPYNGEGDITWSSSSNSIATVSSTGVITGVSPGNCTITATCGSLTDTANITIESAASSSSSLEIELVKANGWSNVIQYNPKVKNLTNQTITTWSFDVTLPAGCRHDGGWNATVTNIGGTTYHVVCNNIAIQPNQSATMGAVGLQFTVPSQSYIPIVENISP